MRRRSHTVRRKAASVLVTAVMVVAGHVTAGSAQASEKSEVELRAADGVRVFADYLAVDGGRTRPIVLLFHQAGSNTAEYDPIVPRLARRGFDTLAVDSRSGGRMFNRNNRTVIALGRAEPFDAAYADLEAALAWAGRRGYPGAVAWGSSYTAALVLRLAAENESVRAVLSFSPGEHLGAGERVRGYATRVTVPLFVASAPGTEVREAARIIDGTDASLVTQYAARTGVHGSSALRADRNPSSYLEYWDAVEAFLDARVLRHAETRSPPAAPSGAETVLP